MRIILLSSLILLVGCSKPAADKRLTLTGSSTVAPLVLEIAKRYEAANPGVRIDVQTGGSSRGIADARRGTADVGMASRALLPEEQDLQGHPIARDGICVIVHADNTVATLSDAQIRAIYTGTITNWAEVEGPDSSITVVHKADGRSTQELFLKHFDLAAEAVNADVIIGDNEQGIKTVAGSSQTIGYVSIGAAEFARDDAVPIRLLPIGGIAPSTENVANRSFPLSRDLSLVTAGPVRPLAQGFIEFAKSATVHDLVQKQFFVPLEP